MHKWSMLLRSNMNIVDQRTIGLSSCFAETYRCNHRINYISLHLCRRTVCGRAWVCSSELYINRITHLISLSLVLHEKPKGEKVKRTKKMEIQQSKEIVFCSQLDVFGWGKWRKNSHFSNNKNPTVCGFPPDDTVSPLCHHKSFSWQSVLQFAFCLGSRLADVFRREDEKIEIRLIFVYICKGGADIWKKFVDFPSIVFSLDVDGGETPSQRHPTACSMELGTMQTIHSTAGTKRNSEDDETV